MLENNPRQLTPIPLASYAPIVELESGLIHLSGQGCRDPETNRCVGIKRATDGSIESYDIRVQTAGVLRNIAALLRERGLGFSNLTDVIIFLKSKDDVAAVNDIWNENFPDPDQAPKQKIFFVTDLPGENFIEMKAQASREKDVEKNKESILLLEQAGNYKEVNGPTKSSDFRIQAEAEFNNIATLLREHDLEFNHLIDMTIFMKSKNDFMAMNEVWNEIFAATHNPPTRTTVFINNLANNHLIEIKAKASRLKRVE